MYSDRYGNETSVVRMHSGNGPHEEMDLRAIERFDHALADVGLADDEQLFHVLHDYFAWATTTTMSRYDGSGRPADLEVIVRSSLVVGGSRTRGQTSTPPSRPPSTTVATTMTGRPRHHGDAMMVLESLMSSPGRSA